MLRSAKLIFVSLRASRHVGYNCCSLAVSVENISEISEIRRPAGGVVAVLLVKADDDVAPHIFAFHNAVNKADFFAFVENSYHVAVGIIHHVVGYVIEFMKPCFEVFIVFFIVIFIYGVFDAVFFQIDFIFLLGASEINAEKFVRVLLRYGSQFLNVNFHLGFVLSVERLADVLTRIFRHRFVKFLKAVVRQSLNADCVARPAL